MKEVEKLSVKFSNDKPKQRSIEKGNNMGWFTNDNKQTIDVNGQKTINVTNDINAWVTICILVLCFLKIVELVISLYRAHIRIIQRRSQRQREVREPV